MKRLFLMMLLSPSLLIPTAIVISPANAVNVKMNSPVEILDDFNLGNSKNYFICNSGLVYLSTQHLDKYKQGFNVIQVYNDEGKPMTCEEFKSKMVKEYIKSEE